MEMSPAGIKFKVLDIQQAVDYLLRTGIFKVNKTMPGTGGAYMVMLRSIEGITPVELIIEQPHESRLNNWAVTTGIEISLKCKDIKTLEDIHRSLQDAGISVTEFFSRPWGGQFWLHDANGNHFMFINESGEWIKE